MENLYSRFIPFWRWLTERRWLIEQCLILGIKDGLHRLETPLANTYCFFDHRQLIVHQTQLLVDIACEETILKVCKNIASSMV